MRNMDQSTHLRNTSLQRRRKTKNGNEDIVSKLPDGILHSILSFLPTKDAIRTSVLSRRWEYLWTSLSNLELDYLKQWTSSFLNFVDRVLMLHDESDIKSFRLRFFYGPVDASRVNSWVSAALMHNCSELDLTLPKGSYALPCCLFTCQSLTVLKIAIYFSLFKVPTSVNLPSLKCLHLSSLKLDNNCSSLFSCCPVLQELTLHDCNWYNLKFLTIANPSLKCLKVSFIILGQGQLEAELKIYASNLTSFEFFSFCKIDVSLLYAPSLVSAYVQQYFEYEWRREAGRLAIKLLAQMNNVKRLKLHDETLKALSEADNFLVHLPTFHNLTRLKVVGNGISSETAKALVEIMLKVPTLKSLVICEDE